MAPFLELPASLMAIPTLPDVQAVIQLGLKWETRLLKVSFITAGGFD